MGNDKLAVGDEMLAIKRPLISPQGALRPLVCRLSSLTNPTHNTIPFWID